MAPRINEFNKAERFPKMPVYPGLNTQFMGILEYPYVGK